MKTGQDKNTKPALERYKKREKLRLRTPQIIVLGFLSIIVAGALLLMLPFSSRGGLGFTDALFTSISAVCVTGLVTVDLTSAFTIFGQVIILLLLQTGSLGFMTMATLVFLAIGKRITLRGRIAMQDGLRQETHQGVVRMTRTILLGTLLIELAGFLLLLPFFIINFGGIGVFKALFTAVSAFGNCGMDIMGDTATGAFSSLTGFGSGLYYGRVAVLLSVAFLVFLGGLGFAVITDVCRKKRFGRLRLHTKLALITTAALLVSGFAVFMAAEYNNPQTIGGMGFGDKVLNCIFMTVSPRTAGFTGISAAELSPISRFWTMILMFIGACPASTGGGIKTTTAAILIISALSGMRNNEDINVGGRTITRRAALKSLAVFLFALIFVLAATMAMMVTEQASAVAEKGLFSMENLLFEVVSAFSTAGLTVGITPFLSVAGKYIVMLLMFCGRLGPITIGLIFTRSDKPKLLKYPEAHIMIG